MLRAARQAVEAVSFVDDASASDGQRLMKVKESSSALQRTVNDWFNDHQATANDLRVENEPFIRVNVESSAGALKKVLNPVLHKLEEQVEQSTPSIKEKLLRRRVLSQEIEHYQEKVSRLLLKPQSITEIALKAESNQCKLRDAIDKHKTIDFEIKQKLENFERIVASLDQLTASVLDAFRNSLCSPYSNPAAEFETLATPATDPNAQESPFVIFALESPLDALKELADCNPSLVDSGMVAAVLSRANRSRGESLDCLAALLSHLPAVRGLEPVCSHFFAAPGHGTIAEGDKVVSKLFKFGLEPGIVCNVEFIDSFGFCLRRVADDRLVDGRFQLSNLSKAGDSACLTLLHIACILNCTDIIIGKILHWCPDASAHSDAFNRRPLHIAARSCSSHTTKAIFEAYRKADVASVALILSRWRIDTHDNLAAMLQTLSPDVGLQVITKQCGLLGSPVAGAIEVGDLVVTMDYFNGLSPGLLCVVASKDQRGFRLAANDIIGSKFIEGHFPINRLTKATNDGADFTLLHLAVALSCPLPAMKLVLELNHLASSAVDAFGRTPFAIAAQRDEHHSYLAVLLKPNPAAATHECARLRLRISFATGDKAVIQIFHLNAAIVFDEYWRWRIGSRRDFEQIEGSMPCEPLIRLLVDAGGDVENLLFIAATAESASYASVLLERFGATGLIALGPGGTTARDVGIVSTNEQIAALYRPLGALYRRYLLESGPPVHVSKNCKVIFGIDLQNDRPVALKLMSNKSQFRREIEARITRNREPIMNVIKLLCWHCPASDGYSDTTGREPETEVSEVGSYVVVMARGERSLHESVAKERFAGYDVPKVIAAASSIAHALCELHQHGMIHCDIKQRNLVRVASGEYALIDLDGSAAIGDQCGWKSSTAYIAPELARARFNTAKVEVGCVENSGGQVVASTSLDCFSFGVVLFELCSGRPLWPQDSSNDDIIAAFNIHLCAWSGASNTLLNDIFASDESPQSCQSSGDFLKLRIYAQHLVRWCLHQLPAARPTFSEILAHPLFNPHLLDLSPILPETYFAFLSHAQAEAAGTAASIYSGLASFGLSSWLDTKQKNVTLDGMLQGIRNSSVFLLILTKSTLNRPYCRKEILGAVSEGKLIIPLLETDTRFAPFDRISFEAFLGANDPLSTSESETHDEFVMAATAVFKALTRAVNIRRRDHEADAMIREISRRSGLLLPHCSSCSGNVPQIPLRIRIIFDDSNPTAVDMARDLVKELEVVAEQIGDVESPNKVLVMLTAGVFKQDSKWLGSIQRLLSEDAHNKTDRLALVYLPENNSLDSSCCWDFSGDEVRSSTQIVQDALLCHEAIAFRCRKSSVTEAHEWRAMIDQLKLNLGRLPDLEHDSMALEPHLGLRDNLFTERALRKTVEEALDREMVLREKAEHLVLVAAQEVASLKTQLEILRDQAPR